MKKNERQWKIWRTISFPTGLRTADDFDDALLEGGFKIGSGALDILKKSVFTVAASAKETKLNLFKVTVAEFGFKNGAPRDQVYKRAKELGFEPCPPEVGPQLRLQCQNQSGGDGILVAIEPIVDSDGYLKVFHLSCHDSGLWLHDYWGDPGRFWHSDFQVVFCRPCKQS